MVYGKRVGTTLTVCTDDHCPIHGPATAERRAKQEAENPTPGMAPAPEEEEESEAEYEQRRQEHQAEEERRAEERRQQFEREKQQQEAERERRNKQRRQREVTFERILASAPETLSAAQLRVLLRAIVHLDPYTFADDLAADISEESENKSNDHRDAEEVLLSAIDGTEDEKLPYFAIRLALSGHVGIPRENKYDLLTEAEAVFVPRTSKKRSIGKAKQTMSKPKKAAAARKALGA